MRESVSVALFVLGIGIVWLALAVSTPSEPLAGIGLALLLTGAVGLVRLYRRGSRTMEIRRQIEKVEAMREGLYK